MDATTHQVIAAIVFSSICLFFVHLFFRDVFKTWRNITDSWARAIERTLTIKDR